MTKKIIFLIIIVLFLLGIALTYVLYSDMEKKTINYQYEQKEIYAKQTSLSMMNFFEKLEHSLSYLTQNESIKQFEENSKQSIKNYYISHQSELNAVTRISSEGKILYTYPYADSVIGKDISFRTHNKELMNSHKATLSDVINTVQGYRAIIYGFPIFRNGNYDGSINILIPFDYIANKFLKGLEFGNSGTSFTISEAGVCLYSSYEGHVGKQFVSVVEGYSEFEEMIGKMMNMEEGRAEYEYLDNNTQEVVKKIAIFKPVEICGTFWSIGISMNREEAINTNIDFVRKFVALMFLILIILGILVLYIAKQRRRSREEIKRRETKYKEDLEKLVQIRTNELNDLNESLKDDIIQRKKIEFELKTAIDKVAKSEKIKSEFLAQMSHEIRTPINTILSFSALIKEELAQHADEELSYGFSGIQSAGKRLIRTIDLILNMSDVQLGTQEYIPVEFDIRKEILDKLIVEYRVQINEKNLKLDLINKSENIKIIADTYTVNQIFANLIDNAIKYTDEGSILIECNRNENDKLEVIITDTGIGISEEYLPKIFDEFSQEDMGYTRKFEGNGLGLALVKRYCSLNNAEINVESKKGEGTKFTVIFSNS